MSKFAVKGNINSPDALVSLALMRSLLAALQKSGALKPDDVRQIVTVAKQEIPSSMSNPNFDEARRLLDEF